MKDSLMYTQNDFNIITQSSSVQKWCRGQDGIKLNIFIEFMEV